MPPRPSRAILSPTSRRLVAILLLTAGALLTLGQLLRLWVLYYDWRYLQQWAPGPLAGVLFGLGAGVLLGYAGWRVGRGG